MTAVHCPQAPICVWAATLAGADHERAIRADQTRLIFREIGARARDLEWSSRKLLELTEQANPSVKEVQARMDDMRRIAARVVRALDDAAAENAA